MVILVDVGYKSVFLFFSLFCATLLSGCVTNSEGGTDVTAFAQSLPQVKEFLAQYPTAKIVVTLWDSTTVEKNIVSIRADCGEQFAVGDYYKVAITDPSFSLVVWLDKSTQNVMCAIKGPTGVAAASVTPAQPVESTATPKSSAVPSVGLPPMPPEPTPAVTGSPEMPPLPPQEELTYEEYNCTKNGGHWNACASPCEGREDTACIQMCVARCEYGNSSEIQKPPVSCIGAGQGVPVIPDVPKCCEGLVLNQSSGARGADGVLGYCTYPVSPVADGCKWVAIECSHFGGVWTGKPIECNKANEGKVGIGPGGAIGGAVVPEAYTSEKWGTCFTPRAMCYCGNVAIPTPVPSATPTVIACPQWSLPSPNWCGNGTIVKSEPDEYGCAQPPKCVANASGEQEGGGPCYYQAYNGTCKVTGLTDTEVRFWFTSQDPAAAQSGGFNLSATEKTDAISYFAPNATKASALKVNGTYSCTASVETQGTCTPIIFRLS